MSEWADQPKQKEFQLTINTPEGFTRELACNIGNCAIALFRMRPEMDYLARLNSEGKWDFYFGLQPLCYWMGGVAVSKEAQHEKHLIERNTGTFRGLCGWNADVLINDYPNEDELERYLDVIIGNDLQDPHGGLSKELEKDLTEEEEDD